MTLNCLVPAAQVIHGSKGRDIILLNGGKSVAPKIANAAQLQLKHFPEIPFIVPRYVAPGLTPTRGETQNWKKLAVSGHRNFSNYRSLLPWRCQMQ
jgi:hypothetical protein